MVFVISHWRWLTINSQADSLSPAQQQKQPIIHIVEAIDGKLVFKSCGLGLSKCSASHPCPIHDEYKEARDIVENLCRQKKVLDLCEPVNNGLAYLMG